MPFDDGKDGHTAPPRENKKGMRAAVSCRSLSLFLWVISQAGRREQAATPAAWATWTAVANCRRAG